MAKSIHRFAKRQREVAKKKKTEEKRRRKLERKSGMTEKETRSPSEDAGPEDSSE